MNILIICDGYPSVSEPNIYIFVHRQALALKRAGHNVFVLDIDLRSIRWKRKFGFNYEKYDNIDIFRFSFPFITTKFPNIYRFLNQKIALMVIKKIQKKAGTSFDCINAHFVQGAGEAAVKLKERYGIPVIITEHSSKILKNQNQYAKRFVDTYKKSDKVIVVGKSLKKRLEEYGVEATIVPNIIDTEIFKPVNIERDSKAYRFLSVGGMVQRKRFDLSVRAFSALKNKYPTTALVLVGQGELENEMRELVNQLEVSDVSFIKSVKNDEMPNLYNSVDCFILPSDVETFGMVYAEAIACGIPAIGANNGGATEMIIHQTGRIVPTNNLECLINAMEDVYTNQKSFDKNFMHNYIDSKFGERAFIEAFYKTYEDIVRKKEHHV